MRQIVTVMIPAHDIHDQLMAQVILLLHQLEKHVEDEMRGPRMDKEKTKIKSRCKTTRATYGHMVWPHPSSLGTFCTYVRANPLR